LEAKIPSSGSVLLSTPYRAAKVLLDSKPLERRCTHDPETDMLDKLEFMIALAREKHFGRAAESCGVAQPTLSQGIQSLEEIFNVPLVKRSSRFQGFTPEGERVLVWARRLVGDAHAMRQEILGLQKGVGAHIRIAAIPSAMPVVASITAPFQL